MTKILVKLVKYDMHKTKKRNRKNMLVESRTEDAVVAQLEKIHKGDKVDTIHEIVWDEEQIEKSEQAAAIRESHIMVGEVKFFDPDKGFGFIAPDDEEVEDLFFHQTALSGAGPNDHDRVEFEISQSPKGLCAVKIKIIKEF